MKYQNVIDLIKRIHDTFGLLTTEGVRTKHLSGYFYGTEHPHKPSLLLNDESDLVNELHVIISGSYLTSSCIPLRMYNFQFLNDCLLKIAKCINDGVPCDDEVNQVNDWLNKSIESKNNILK